MAVNFPGAYVGIPFGEGVGELTCWGLVRAVYASELDVTLPAYGEISARDLVRVAREIGTGQAADCWHPVTTPQRFDVCLMRSARGGRAIVHVGVMVDAKTVLHVEAAAHAALVPLSHYSIAGRLAGFRRYAA